MQLMPLVIRYCFKDCHVFYEFQWEARKSPQVHGETYRHTASDTVSIFAARQDQSLRMKGERRLNAFAFVTTGLILRSQMPRAVWVVRHGHLIVTTACGPVLLHPTHYDSTVSCHCRRMAQFETTLGWLWFAYGGSALATDQLAPAFSRLFCAQRSHSTTFLQARVV
jgi:hypothetical protein